MLLVLLLLSITAAAAQPLDYTISAGGQDKILLEVEKTGFLKGKKHSFEFPNYSGKLTYDAQTPGNSRVELKIDAASLVCKDTWVSPKDLKKIQDEALTKVLVVSKYPDMRFTSTKVTPQGGNKFQVEGVLTIRGTGKPVTMTVSLDPASMKMDGKSSFKMSAYGIKPPSAGLGTVGTKDDMTATFAVTARK
ncbi:MAG: YceI family protein [Bryobacterales bacterium]|nr:YceI family protein [Bryobacterales bacterium]